MSLSPRDGPPPKLSTIIGQVSDLLVSMGNATPVLVGDKYLEDVSGDPQIVFVPDKSGRLENPIEMGSAASVVHSCDVYIRAPETGDDLTRLDNAETLEDLVIDCVSRAACGRVEWGDHHEDSPTKTDAFGADVVLSFTFRRDVRHGSAWQVPAATPDTAPKVSATGLPALTVGSTPVNVLPSEV